MPPPLSLIGFLLTIVLFAMATRITSSVNVNKTGTAKISCHVAINKGDDDLLLSTVGKGQQTHNYVAKQNVVTGCSSCSKITYLYSKNVTSSIRSCESYVHPDGCQIKGRLTACYCSNSLCNKSESSTRFHRHYLTNKLIMVSSTVVLLIGVT